MKALVLERHADISDARRLMRTWSDIADALGLSRARSKDLAGCFARVEKGIRAGKLMTGRVVQARKTVERPAPVSGKRSLPRVDDVQDGEDDGLTEAERILKSIPHL
jgi:hypothetical protein